MPRLDAYLRGLGRAGAVGITLASDTNVALRLPGGHRFTAQVTAHDDLVSLVEEVAPPNVLQKVRAGGAAEFPYLVEGRGFKLRVEAAGTRWVLEATVVEGTPTSQTTPPAVAAAKPVNGIAAMWAAAAAAAPVEPLPRGRTPVEVPAVDGISAPRGRTPVAVPAVEPAGLRGRTPVAVPAVERNGMGQGLERSTPVAVPAVSGAQRPARDLTPGRGVAVDRRTPVAVLAVPRAHAAPPPPPPPSIDVELDGALQPDPVSQPHAVTSPPQAIAAQPAGPPRIDRLLVEMRDVGASDLHLTTSMPPMVRVHGQMRPLPGHPPLAPNYLLALIDEIAPPRNRAEFTERHDTDFAYEMPDVARFRVNVFRDRRGPGAVVRAIPYGILSASKLGLPPKVLELCQLTKGLVLVTGPTGSGKSTTLAALIDHINQTRDDHIITIEDPIEFVHESKRCLVNQREVSQHTRSFKDALRAALREDPDIVLVGEMRDLETVALAVETAETGHLVFGTLHTSTAPSTVDRIIDQFPPDRQEQVRQMLSESLRGVISQTLCKKIGGGRVAAYEILLGSPAISNLIRERKTFQIFSLMQTQRGAGMCTLNDALMDLVRRRLVDPAEAYLKSMNKAELKGLLARDGVKLDLSTNDEPVTAN